MSEIIFKQNLPFARFETHNEKPNFELLHLKQIHSNIIVPPEKNLNQADGFFIPHFFKTPIAIITADCMPIVVHGKNGNAFLHAGWRGLAGGILTAQEVIDLEPNYFFFGPHIHYKNYEVQEDFRANFPDRDYFISKNNKLYFDLTTCAKGLISSQYPHAKIESAETCTFEHPKLHSYRRDGTALRNWNILIPFVDP